MRLIALARRRTSASPASPASSDAGFSLMEVIVAVFILTIVMAAATAFFINNAHSVGGQSQRQNAVYLADQQLEAVRSVPADKLVKGRTLAVVTALHATPGASALIAQDDTSAGNYDTTAAAGATPEIATTQTKTVNNVPYTVRTFINRCWYDPATQVCGSTSSSTTTQEYRVIVDVSWAPTGQRACSGGCSYAASALIDPNADPSFNSNISQPTVSGTSPTSMAATTVDSTFVINGSEFVSGATVTISTGGGTFGAIPANGNTGTSITLPFTAGNTPGSYTVSVINPDGGRATTSFTVNPLPNITSATPVPSPLTGNTSTTLTLDGTGFQNGATVAATNGVAIGSVTWLSATQLRLNSVVGPAAGGSSVITVTNPDGGTDTLTVTFKSKPTVSSVSSSTGGPYRNIPTTLTLDGTGFQAGVSVVATNASVTSVTFVNSTRVTVGYTATVNGTSTLTLTNPDGGTTTRNVTVATAPTPTISSFTGTAVKNTNRTFTISGSNFFPGATVVYRNQANTVTYYNGPATYVSSAQLTFVANMGATTGSIPVTVTVTNPDGQTVSFNRNVTVS